MISPARRWADPIALSASSQSEVYLQETAVVVAARRWGRTAATDILWVVAIDTP